MTDDRQGRRFCLALLVASVASSCPSRTGASFTAGAVSADVFARGEASGVRSCPPAVAEKRPAACCGEGSWSSTWAGHDSFGRHRPSTATVLAGGIAASLAASVARRAMKGFGAAAQKEAKRKRKKVPPLADLQVEHGEDMGKAVEKVLRGGAATSPEELMRSRFTASKLKDSLFMARTEEDGRPLEARIKQWDSSFGIATVQTGDQDMFQNSFQHVEKLEIIEATGLEVEFKVYCGTHGTLHERSFFKEHEKMGYIYACDSAFAKWTK